MFTSDIWWFKWLSLSVFWKGTYPRPMICPATLPSVRKTATVAFVNPRNFFGEISPTYWGCILKENPSERKRVAKKSIENWPACHLRGHVIKTILHCREALLSYGQLREGLQWHQMNQKGRKREGEACVKKDAELTTLESASPLKHCIPAEFCPYTNPI